MRDDPWLAKRLGLDAVWWEPGDAPGTVAASVRERSPSFGQARVGLGETAALAEMEDAGFRVVDVTITMAGAPVEAAAAGVDISDATPDDLPQLLEIAENHYGVSRFHLDPQVPDSSAGRVKRDWLAAYAERTRGDRLLAARVGGKPIGFLAQLSRPDGIEVIDLIAVHPDHRARGAGAALVGALDGNRIEAGTQASNLGALRFYGRLGFQVIAGAYVLHLHA